MKQNEDAELSVREKLPQQMSSVQNPGWLMIIYLESYGIIRPSIHPGNYRNPIDGSGIAAAVFVAGAEGSARTASDICCVVDVPVAQQLTIRRTT